MYEAIAKFFNERGWRWSFKGKGKIVPSEEDVEILLDEVANQLYDEPVGTQLQVGRLIIIKTDTGHEVYMFAGTYI